MHDAYARLARYDRSGLPGYTMQYDGLDQRVAVFAGMAVRHFVYDEDGRLIGEYGAKVTTAPAEHVWLVPEAEGADAYQPLALLGSNRTSWVTGDHLGTPVLLTNVAGAVVNAYDTTPFGQRWFTRSAMPTTAQAFPGQLIDIADRYYNMHRDYDPTLGRYLQADPIGLAGGDNTYTYAANNPLIYTDPTGEFVPQLVGFVLGAGLEALTNPCASAVDILLAGAFGTVGGGLSKAAFLSLGAKSLTRETGKEWSHGIARKQVDRYTSGTVNKFLNQRGGLNGSWRTPPSHARHDMSRHVDGVDRMSLPLRALDRVPDWLKGTAASAGAGAGIAGGRCECD